MSKRAPSTAQLLVIAGFALSCFGILLFLWITFGGPTPFKAKPYEIKVPFNEATQLAQQSDVRISGVSVGKVQNIEESPDGQQAQATIDIEDKYAPIPKGTRAILRTKTLLGETYVELTPGNADGPKLPDGGTLARGQRGRIGAARRDLPHLRPAYPRRLPGMDAGRRRRDRRPGPVLLQRARRARTRSSPNSTSSSACSTRSASRSSSCSATAPSPSAPCAGAKAQLASLIRNSNAVFQTTAARDRDIEALFRAFPTFEDESRLTFNRLKAFALNSDPLFRQLVPAAEQLSPTLIAFSKLAPQAKGFFEGLETVIDRAPSGFPALRKFLRGDFPVLLRALDPFLRNLNPILTGLGLYKNEVTSLLGNVDRGDQRGPPQLAAGEQIHYLRLLGPLGPESLATYPNRTTTNRNNAYSQPGAYNRLAKGLLSFDTRQCSSGITATLNPNTPNERAFNERTKGDVTKADRLLQPAQALRLRRTGPARRASPPRAAARRRPSSRSTAAARRRPTSTPSNRANRHARGGHWAAPLRLLISGKKKGGLSAALFSSLEASAYRVWLNPFPVQGTASVPLSEVVAPSPGVWASFLKSTFWSRWP